MFRESNVTKKYKQYIHARADYSISPPQATRFLPPNHNSVTTKDTPAFQRESSDNKIFYAQFSKRMDSTKEIKVEW